jgi:hypothetical protein
MSYTVIILLGFGDTDSAILQIVEQYDSYDTMSLVLH